MLLTDLPKPSRSTVLGKSLWPIWIVCTWYRLIIQVFVAHLRVYLHDVLFPEPHGFCSGQSVVTGVATLLPVLEQASRSPRGCHVLFLDITKAYDLVDRAVMDQVMTYLGVSLSPFYHLYCVAHDYRQAFMTGSSSLSEGFWMHSGIK